MFRRPPLSDLEAELARARNLLAAGKRREALTLALNLLHQALETLHRHLLVLHHELVQAQAAIAAGSDESLNDHPAEMKAIRRQYH